MKKDKNYQRFIFCLTGTVIFSILLGICIGIFIGIPIHSKLTEYHAGDYHNYSISIYPESGKTIIRTNIENVQQYEDKLVVLGEPVTEVKD